MKPRVLIAEDRPEIREALVTALAARDCEVIAVASGDDAFKIIQTEKIDLVISDIRMPQGTGIQLLRRVRRLRLASQTVPPIIIITAILGSGEHYLKALGACEIFIKPFKLSELVDAALKHMSRTRS